MKPNPFRVTTVRAQSGACVRALLLAALALPALLPARAQAAPFSFTFETRPAGGALNGNPGQQLGWGYSLHNTDTVSWFVPTQLSATSFSLGILDAAYFDFPILAPDQVAGADFDAALLQGLYGVLLSAGATAGSSESGTFTLSGEWWNGDPSGGGKLLQLSDAVQAAFAVQVGVAAVPAPATLPLLAAGALALLAFQRQHRDRRNEGRQAGGCLR